MVTSLFSGCGGDNSSKGEPETEEGLPEITARIASGDVYAPDYDLFLNNAPFLKIFDNGLMVTSYHAPETNQVYWREEELGLEGYEQLYQEIVHLGVWNWDLEGINAQLDELMNMNQDLYRLPNYSLRVVSPKREKSFSAKGIHVIHDSYHVQSLENPCKVFDLLDTLEADGDLYIPNEIELFVVSGDTYGYDYLNSDDIAPDQWPFENIQLDAIAYDEWKEDSIVSLSGAPVKSAVELISRQPYFSYKGRVFLVRYRPVF